MRDLIDDIKQRDLADQSRELSPLLPADATVIDTPKCLLRKFLALLKS